MASRLHRSIGSPSRRAPAKTAYRTPPRLVVTDAFDVAVDVLATAPVPLGAGLRLPRALCRFELDDGATSGVGWAEWVQAVEP